MSWIAAGVLAGCGALALVNAGAQPRPPDVQQRRFPPVPDPPPSDEALPPAPAKQAEATACNDLSAQERLSCPLRSETVIAREPIEQGVLLTLRRKSPTEAHLRRILRCQGAVYRAEPSIPPPCPFLADGVWFEVSRRQGRVTVAVTIVADGPIGVGVLRERIETALPPRSRSPRE